MRFVIDAQLPPALAVLLKERGHIAEHVLDLGLCSADDAAIWDYALESHSVILTKDEDFPRRYHQSRQSPAIVWVRVGNVSRKELLKWFTPLLPQIVELLEQGSRLVELR